MLEIGYAGSHGLHMMRTQDVNQPLPNVGIANKTLNANQLRPYLGYGIISNREQSYASKYNGLQVELSRRFSHGLHVQGGLHLVEGLDTTDCCSGNIYNFYPNTQNANLEWGRSSMDAEHNFIANFVYELPFMRDQARSRRASFWAGGSFRESRPSRPAFRSIRCWASIRPESAAPRGSGRRLSAARSSTVATAP